MKRGSRKKPRRLGEVLERLVEDKSPKTPLASAQAVWPAVVGDGLAAVTEVISERDGVLTVRCESSVWAHELEMMSPRLIELLAARLGEFAPASLRFLT